MIKRYFYIYSASLFILLTSTTGVRATVENHNLETLARQTNSPPDGFNYQAVLRDNNGDAIINSDITMRFTLSNEMGVVWIESHAAKTNAYGMVTLIIGTGSRVGGSADTFSAIDWSTNISINVEGDSGSGFVALGTSDLQSVPYANFAKNGITPEQVAEIKANTAKGGITPEQAEIISMISGINTGDQDISGIEKNAIAIALNTAKVGITTAQADAITANTAKVGITTAQADAITANTAKVSITTEQADAIIANTAKVGITTAQATAITVNTAKVGITNAQADAIITNTRKIGITPEQAAAIIANTAKGSGSFTTASDLVYAGDDNDSFLFGSTQLDNIAENEADDNRMFFDKNTGAFRVGGAYSYEWDAANLGRFSSVSGGNNNQAKGQYSNVGGGSRNTVNADGSTITGGIYNQIFGTGYTQGKVTESANSIGGGSRNTINENSDNSIISGGYRNSVTGRSVTIGGGSSNTVNSIWSTIAGGYKNQIKDGGPTYGGYTPSYSYPSSYANAIGGGYRNTINENSSNSIISGGSRNSITGKYITIGGGNSNQALAYGASILGGGNNYASGRFSAVGGGRSVRAESLGEFAVGLYSSNATDPNATTFVPTDRIFTVGNGEYGTPSNAMTILKNGDMTLQGTLTLGSDATTSFTLPNTRGTTDQVLKTDADGMVTWADAGGGSGSFTTASDLVYAGDDNDSFVFGSTQLDNIAESPEDDNRMFFDKNTGAFRVGGAYGNEWDAANLGRFSSVSGGYNNQAKQRYSTVGGGSRNTVNSDGSTIAGGIANEIKGTENTQIIGKSTGIANSIGGGSNNTINEYSSSSIISGGYNNSVTGSNVTIGGGSGNTVNSPSSTIAGGTDNEIKGTGNTLDRGKVIESFNFIGGGSNNTINEYSYSSIISGGANNSVTGSSVTIGGGYYNTINERSSGSIISGGSRNSVTGYNATIGGGYGNQALAEGASIIGGINNNVTGNFSAVGGGRSVTAQSFGEFAVGLYSLNATSSNSTEFVATDRIFTVGNGTGQGYESNAMTILKNGNTAINGALVAKSLGVDGGFTLPTTDGTSGQVLSTNGMGEVVWSAPAGGGSGSFTTAYGLVYGGGATDSFVFGSTQLDDAPGTDDDNRMFFDKNTGAFRVGGAYGNEWDAANLGRFSSVSGGYNNQAKREYSTVGGGYANTVNSDVSTIAGGKRNQIEGGRYNSIGGGLRNTINEDSHGSIISGGYNNSVTGRGVTIGGGNGNTINALSNSSIISGGANNSVTGNWISIGGGNGNQALANGASILGGLGNFVSGNYGAVGGGVAVKAESFGEFAVGLFSLNATSPNSTEFVATDRIFTVGNGTSLGYESNAFTILKNGNATLLGELSQSSDSRLKREIAPLGSTLDKVNEMEGVTYKWNDLTPRDTTEVNIGLIAQEVEKLFPELVKDGDNGYKSVNYIHLVPVLIEAIKELSKQNDALASANAQMEIKNAQMEIKQKGDDDKFALLEAKLNMLMQLVTPKVASKED